MLTMRLKDGTRFSIRSIDGGGQFTADMWETDAYHVHYADEHGRGGEVAQSRVASVTDDDTGEPVHFGNEWFPGHPDYDPDRNIEEEQL